MRSNYLYFTLAYILSLRTLSILSASATDFDFFVLIHEWPGSHCRGVNGCCLPPTGKPPSNLMLHGLLPFNNNGTYPSFCERSRPYDQSHVSDLLGRMQTEWPTVTCPSNNGTDFWKLEWEEHGTCAAPIFKDEHSYFKFVLDLKVMVNLFQHLKDSGIEPNGKSYSKNSIEQAINKGIGQVPHLECNIDGSGKTQLLWIACCVSKSLQPMQCPPLPVFFPKSKCDPNNIKFPAF